MAMGYQHKHTHRIQEDFWDCYVKKIYVDGAIWTHQAINFCSQTTPCRGMACETSPSPIFGRRSQSCGMKQEEEMMK